MTQPEVWLWGRLKRLHAHGYHFRRERPFLGYFLDFVCHDRMLIVELDGAQHGEPLQAEHDAVRDAILIRAGFQGMRFSNLAARSNIDGVMDSIALALEARPSLRRKPSPDHST